MKSEAMDSLMQSLHDKVKDSVEKKEMNQMTKNAPEHDFPSVRPRGEVQGAAALEKNPGCNLSIAGNSMTRRSTECRSLRRASCMAGPA